MQWQAVACSAIGTKHIKKGTPCQDSVCHEIISEQIIIGAVSDGMGSARRSEVGSDLAVKTALSQMKSMSCLQNQPKNDEEVREIFRSVLGKVIATLKKEAENGGYSVEELDCTLLAFIATPKWLAAMQVGDGLIVVRPRGGIYELLFMPDKGEYANVTTPVTASNAVQEMQVCLKSGGYEFICAATDGIENISLVRQEGWKPFERFFKPLEEQIMLSANTPTQKEKEIHDFLNSEAVNQKTDDDKTLLLCVYNNFANSQNSVTKSENLPFEQPKIEAGTKPRGEGASIPQPKASIPLTNQNIINQELARIKASIVNTPEAQGITPSLKIKNSFLSCEFISDKSLPCQQMLSQSIRQQVLNSQIPKLLKVNKIEVYNYPKNSEDYYWLETIHLGEFPYWLFDLATVITITLVMTFFAGFIQTLLPSFLGILTYFFVNLIIISFVWFFRHRRN